ncbi:uncharacterized protein EI90DRAFT_2660343 [Cantharellus anzutake]|uniref:uncharacterized protein n=1 Tax=Cantharellus anzutake TaxID=1750568 RepID=UPI001906DB10|nr:uncharacterized protein EI90DRAFT_2660343 [Cantharellus anzutake]KAF8337522.1 hypothetical protein EI90DRAFT_2660343 [Cantharellus anzutake]
MNVGAGADPETTLYQPQPQHPPQQISHQQQQQQNDWESGTQFSTSQTLTSPESPVQPAHHNHSQSQQPPQSYGQHATHGRGRQQVPPSPLVLSSPSQQYHNPSGWVPPQHQSHQEGVGVVPTSATTAITERASGSGGSGGGGGGGSSALVGNLSPSSAYHHGSGHGHVQGVPTHHAASATVGSYSNPNAPYRHQLGNYGHASSGNLNHPSHPHVASWQQSQAFPSSSSLPPDAQLPVHATLPTIGRPPQHTQQQQPYYSLPPRQSSSSSSSLQQSGLQPQAQQQGQYHHYGVVAQQRIAQTEAPYSATKFYPPNHQPPAQIPHSSMSVIGGSGVGSYPSHASGTYGQSHVSTPVTTFYPSQSPTGVRERHPIVQIPQLPPPLEQQQQQQQQLVLLPQSLLPPSQSQSVLSFTLDSISVPVLPVSVSHSLLPLQHAQGYPQQAQSSHQGYFHQQQHSHSPHQGTPYDSQDSIPAPTSMLYNPQQYQPYPQTAHLPPMPMTGSSSSSSHGFAYDRRYSQPQPLYGYGSPAGGAAPPPAHHPAPQSQVHRPHAPPLYTHSSSNTASSTSLKRAASPFGDELSSMTTTSSSTYDGVGIGSAGKRRRYPPATSMMLTATPAVAPQGVYGFGVPVSGGGNVPDPHAEARARLLSWQQQAAAASAGVTGGVVGTGSGGMYGYRGAQIVRLPAGPSGGGLGGSVMLGDKVVQSPASIPSQTVSQTQTPALGEARPPSGSGGSNFGLGVVNFEASGGQLHSQPYHPQSQLQMQHQQPLKVMNVEERRSARLKASDRLEPGAKKKGDEEDSGAGQDLSSKKEEEEEYEDEEEEEEEESDDDYVEGAEDRVVFTRRTSSRKRGGAMRRRGAGVGAGAGVSRRTRSMSHQA